MSSQEMEPAPEVIAHKFAESYYGMLVQDETYEKLCSFYDKNAVCTRGDEAGGHKNHVTVTGSEVSVDLFNTKKISNRISSISNSIHFIFLPRILKSNWNSCTTRRGTAK
jgi:hypothetical protein